MEWSAVSNLQMISEQTHYLKDWEANDEGFTRQNNTRSCSFIFRYRHSQNSKYVRKDSDLNSKKVQGGKRTSKSVVRIDEHTFQERTTSKRLVSDNNSLPALPKKTNTNKLLSFIFKPHPTEIQALPQTYNTLNLYDILRKDQNPQKTQQPSLPQEKHTQPSHPRKKINPKLRFDFQLIKRKKFAMNIRYMKESSNQNEAKQSQSLSNECQRQKLKGNGQRYSHKFFIKCNQLSKLGDKYSLEIV